MGHIHKNHLLRGQDSNLEPTPYTLPLITKSVDYIIIQVLITLGCEALRTSVLLLFRIVSTPFLHFCKTWLGIALRL